MGYTLIQAHFYLDREQITALYCVNKDQPQLQCDGKCELGKRLAEAKNQSGSQAEITLEELQLVFYPQLVLKLPKRIPETKTVLSTIPYYHGNLTAGAELDFFHPPQGLSS